MADLDLDTLLDTPVVSASKREQRSSQAPVSVSSTSAEELEGTGLISLCDALQYVPGVDCRRGPMRKAAISLRGLGSNFLSNRVLLLTDGRPETDPWTGIFYPDETTPPANLKRVEIIRGPGSSVYGSNAFSGVINVLTRDPEDLIAQGNQVGAEGRLFGGADGTLRAQVTAAGKTGDLSGLVNYSGYRTDGPQLLNDPDRKVVDTQEWASVNQVTGKLKWKYVTANAGYTGSAIGRPGGLEFTTVGNCGRCHATPNDSEAVQNFTADVRADVPVTDGVKVFGDAYVLIKRRDVVLRNDVTREPQEFIGKRRRVGGEVHAQVTQAMWNAIGGVDLKVDDVNNTNIFSELSPSDLRQTVLGVFADGEVRPMDKLRVSAGLRYDHVIIPDIVWRKPSSELSPRAAVIFSPLKDASVRASYGHSFRAPSLAELAINQQMYAATLLGNPDLKAERLDAFELAADYHPEDKGLRLTGTVFFNFAKNLINPVFLGGSTSQFQNIGTANVYGAELEAEAKLPKNVGSVTAGYRVLDTHATGTDALSTGRLDYAPAHRVSLHAHFTYQDMLFADFYGLFLSGRQDAGLLVDDAGNATSHAKLPGYVVAGARLGLRPLEHVTASVSVMNLFNTRYEETLGFPAPSTRVFAELKLAY
ncbi:MAG: TonB-dependent receptor [Myxococcaceae bacterium]|nr:TonB-dependent receptor [Myxococcaceae bacterium]